MKLTTAQIEVLRYLLRHKEADGPPSAPEISHALGHASYWAAGKIKSLEGRELVKCLGVTITNGNCYCITEAGRAALESSTKF